MALIFVDGMDKYGPPNTNTANAPSTITLMTAGDWNTLTGGTNPGQANIVAGLNGVSGYAFQLGSSSASQATIGKTLPGNYARLIGGVRFSGTLGTNGGIQFYDASTAQASISLNSAGTFSVRTGNIGGTALGTSATSVAANAVHFLEWDITFAASGAYQVWLDGVSILSGTGNTHASANNYANVFQLTIANPAGTLTVDDLYLFDTTGTTNNAVLLTSPRVETQFPTGDAAVQFTPGAAILGTITPRITSTTGTAANQFRVRSFTPTRACTLNSISFTPLATSATINLRPVIYGDSSGAPGTLLSSGGTVTGITAATVVTMPLTTPQSLTAGTPYWLGFMCDIALGAAIGNLESLTNDRTATSTFTSGAPGTAPAVSAATSTTFWGNISGTGVNWFETSQNPPQGAQSYVYDSTVGHEDLYSFPALITPPAAIYAAVVKANVAKSDSGARTVSLHMKSGATDGTGSGGTALAPGTSYGWLSSTFETDPNTSAAWTAANLNAAQSGFKIET